jgi:lysophospholipase L1-like esterase
MQGYGGTTTANGIQNERYSIVDLSTDSFLEIMEPDIIVIEYGYHDQNAGETSAEFTTYYTTLLDLLSSHYAGAVLFCLIPFKQSFASEIRAIAASRENCYLIETVDYDISYTDTAHPNEAGAEEIATRLSEDIIKIMSKNFFI